MNPKGPLFPFAKTLPQRSSKFSKYTRFYKHIKYILSLYTTNEYIVVIFYMKLNFSVAKKMKHLDINQTKYIQALYTKTTLDL